MNTVKRTLGMSSLGVVATEREELLYMAYGVRVKELESKVKEKKR